MMRILALDKCNEENSIKKHAVAMIESFNKAKFQVSKPYFSKIWFSKFKEFYNKRFNEKFNEKKLTIKNFKSLYNLYLGSEGHSLQLLREKIEKNEVKEAFDYLIKIDGVGDKVAKFMVRDLIFYLTDWGKMVNATNFPPNLDYALPVDRWVRRITLSIPTLKREVFRVLENEDVDRFISKSIFNVCKQLELNPLRFNLGAYLIGEQKLASKWKKFGENKFSETYKYLKNFEWNAACESV